MNIVVDYARYGRQIALPEIGAEGQLRLSQTPVSFDCDDGATRALCEKIHRLAGGRVIDDAGDPPDERTTVVRSTATLRVRIDAPVDGANSDAGPARLARAAWAAIEAARAVCGAPSGAGTPAELVARLR